MIAFASDKVRNNPRRRQELLYKFNAEKGAFGALLLPCGWIEGDGERNAAMDSIGNAYDHPGKRGWLREKVLRHLEIPDGTEKIQGDLKGDKVYRGLRLIRGRAGSLSRWGGGLFTSIGEPIFSDYPGHERIFRALHYIDALILCFKERRSQQIKDQFERPLEVRMDEKIYQWLGGRVSRVYQVLGGPNLTYDDRNLWDAFGDIKESPIPNFCYAVDAIAEGIVERNMRFEHPEMFRSY